MAYPADAPYSLFFHRAAVREHLVIVTPKEMHLVSDQNNRRTSFPVRRSAAAALGGSRHYSRHSSLDRSVSRSLLPRSGDSTRRRRQFTTPHFALLTIPRRSRIELGSCCLIEVELWSVQPSVSGTGALLLLRCCCVCVCVRTLAFHKELHQSDCLFWQFYHLIKSGVWFTSLDPAQGQVQP